MVTPLVSVITPTWQRHGMLLDRCVPSVQAQTYPAVEHIIVSDGPDKDLAEELADLAAANWWDIRFVQLDEWHGLHWGSRARLAGLEHATGDVIAYLDDDDAYRPEHLATLVPALLSDPAAGFAFSLMASHQGGDPAVIGTPVPAYCNIGTPMIVHHRSLLEVATWGPPSVHEDWDLVERWLAAGTAYVHVGEVTVDVWPSAFRT